MSDSVLAEIDGIKPAVFLADGEEREVESQTSKSTYKIKRTFDHYYCSCPAWRNQGGRPVNARTCKHLKSLLGEPYEAARVEKMNPGGNGPSSSSPTKRKADGDGGRANKRAKPDSSASKKTEKPDILLANKWDVDSGVDPTGWWVSEKLDGVRAYFDGTQFISRLGNTFTAPDWFLKPLPKDVTLDGELYGGRSNFQTTVSVVKTLNSKEWEKHRISFQIFDIPSLGDKPFEKRLEHLQNLFCLGSKHACDHVHVVEHVAAKDRQHVLDMLSDVERQGGEGLMLRESGSRYEGKRSGTLLKIKTFFDAEAAVDGYVPGKGKHKGATGALKCIMASGKKFSVGTGLSDQQRRKPPKVGSIISYRFQELTRDGVPRFPTFLGEAIDKTIAKDADIPRGRIAAAGDDQEK